MLIHSWENGEFMFLFVPAVGATNYGRSVPRGAALLIVGQDIETNIDMDMSYTRVLHIQVAYRVPHK
jgi:hypothetical protein